MEKPADTFFSKLRNLAAKIDKECEQYKLAITEQKDECAVPQAIKDITDLKNDVKQLKVPIRTEIERQRDETQKLNKTASLVSNFLNNYVSIQVTEIEEYLAQYGFKPYEETCKKQNKDIETESEDGHDEESAAPNTPPNNAKPVDPNRTPRLEDAGISMETMQYLNSLQKNKQHPNRAAPASQKCGWGDVPPDFRHNGILCTPSLGKIWSSDISYSTDLHSALASPVLMSSTKEMPVKEEKSTLPFPSQQQLFNTKHSDSPASPVFQTPGIKQILTGTKEHGPSMLTTSSKRPLHVSLFQDDQKDKLVSGESKKELNVPDLTTRYDDGEPVEPELTYSLEALSDMTGMYMINPAKNPTALGSVKQFPSSVDIAINNKENATPPEPEMLTERISRVHIKQESKVTKEFVPIHTTLNDNMPPSPQLFGSYNFK